MQFLLTVQKIDQGTINCLSKGFAREISYFELIFDLFRERELSILPDQNGIDAAIADAATYYPTACPENVKLLLSPPDIVPRPSQYGINEAFINAASNPYSRDMVIIELLLSPPDGVPRPNQVGINKALIRATSNPYIKATDPRIKMLLNPPNGLPKPNKDSITLAIINALKNFSYTQGKSGTQLIYLLLETQADESIGENNINRVFSEAVNYDVTELVQSLLDGSRGNFRTSEGAISICYSNLMIEFSRGNLSLTKHRILSILENRLSEIEKLRSAIPSDLNAIADEM